MQLTLGRQIAYAFKPRPFEGRAAIPVVFEDHAVRHAVALGAGKRDQRSRLAGNRVVLFLPIRGYPGVNRGDLHHPLLEHAHQPDGRAPRHQEIVGLLKLGGELAIEHIVELDMAAFLGFSLSHVSLPTTKTSTRHEPRSRPWSSRWSWRVCVKLPQHRQES